MQYSKREIGRAGAVMASSDAPLEEIARASVRVNYWRQLHLEPLRLLLDDVLAQSANIDGVLVAGRIKKLDTIVDKLRRPDTPSDLQTMYDIAGCRAVVSSLGELEVLRRRMESLPFCDAQKTAKRDYLARPRPSGYRGCHVIFAYPCQGAAAVLHAELQLRTRLQHSWATAVEMYDLATKSRLKFNDERDVAWRFFQLASDLIRGIEEGDASNRQVVSCLRELEARHGVLQTLRTCSQSVNVLGVLPQAAGGECYLVDIDLDQQFVRLDVLEARDAVRAYYDRESQTGSRHNVVLVRGSSVDQLQRLYPNYFGDISDFVNLVGSAIGG